jgi:lipid A disaccharide synthetase
MLEVVRDENYQWRRGVDVALACSGTATLENALLGLPTVVAYKTSWPTYLLARALVQVKHIAMPNILAGNFDAGVHSISSDPGKPFGGTSSLFATPKTFGA